MKRLLVFASACAVTAAVWASFWPRPAHVSPSPPPPPTAEIHWPQDRIAALITAVENAGTTEERLAACSDLLQIPLSDTRSMLERVDIRAKRGLTLVTKTLLIRWASGDGEAAVNWAWKRFRADGVWEEAFREIGPAWAAHDPAGFGKWALRAADKIKPASQTITLAEAGSAEEPLLESGAMRDVPMWLITEDPRLAYQVVRKLGGRSESLPLELDTVAKVRQALSAFDHLDQLSPNAYGQDDVLAKFLLGRWRDIDAEDFAHSPYTGCVFPAPEKKTADVLAGWKALPASERAESASRYATSTDVPALQSDRIGAIANAWSETDPAAAAQWLDSLPAKNASAARSARVSALAPGALAATLEWMDGLPPDQRQSLFVPVFDSWTKAHPGARPDMAGWSDARREAWSDLEALPASGVVSSGG